MSHDINEPKSQRQLVELHADLGSRRRELEDLQTQRAGFIADSYGDNKKAAEEASLLEQEVQKVRDVIASMEEAISLLEREVLKDTIAAIQAQIKANDRERAVLEEQYAQLRAEWQERAKAADEANGKASQARAEVHSLRIDNRILSERLYKLERELNPVVDAPSEEIVVRWTPQPTRRYIA
jgi:chromosome segregation ATPase